MDQCRNPSGEIQDCPLFDIQDASITSNCKIKIPSELAGEDASTVDTLPGNPAIISGPAPAAGATAGAGSSNPSPLPSSSLAFANSQTFNPPSVAVPTLSFSAGSSLASSETYVPGAVFAVQSQSSPTVPAATSVITPPPAAPVNAEQIPVSYFSTDYFTSGLTVNEVLWVEDLVTVTVPPAPARKRHLHKHRGVGI